MLVVQVKRDVEATAQLRDTAKDRQETHRSRG